MKSEDLRRIPDFCKNEKKKIFLNFGAHDVKIIHQFQKEWKSLLQLFFLAAKDWLNPLSALFPFLRIENF